MVCVCAKTAAYLTQAGASCCYSLTNCLPACLSLTQSSLCLFSNTGSNVHLLLLLLLLLIANCMQQNERAAAQLLATPLPVWSRIISIMHSLCHQFAANVQCQISLALLTHCPSAGTANFSSVPLTLFGCFFFWLTLMPKHLIKMPSFCPKIGI